MAEKVLYFANIPPWEILDKLINTFKNEKLKDIPIQFCLLDSSGFSKRVPNTDVSCIQIKEFVESFSPIKDELQKRQYIFPVISIISSARRHNDPCTIDIIRIEKNNKNYKIIIRDSDGSSKAIHLEGKFFDLLDSLNNEFTFTDPIDLARTDLSIEEQKLIETREIITEALQKSCEKMVSVTSENIHNWDNKIREIKDKFEKEHQEKKTKLELDYESKIKHLENEKEVFKQEKAAFDDRERTHVRRELLDKMNLMINANRAVMLSDPTNRKRWPIAVTLSVTLVLLAISEFYSMNLLIKSNDHLYLFPVASFLIAFIATGIFFIKWQNTWVKVHADAELENKKFETDMLRASWLAEMYFEWDENKKVEFPSQMVESFTKNLFEHVTGNAPVNHPYEDIFKNLKSFSKVKFDKTGIQVEKNQVAER